MIFFPIKRSQIFEALSEPRIILRDCYTYVKLITHTNTVCEEFLTQGSAKWGRLLPGAQAVALSTANSFKFWHAAARRLTCWVMK